MDPFYPPSSFYFTVSIRGISGKADAAFQEASGLQADFETEEVACGGENRFKFKLPGVAKFGNLVLKRGFVASGSSLAKWCTDTLGGGLNDPIALRTITVTLLNPKGSALISWDFLNAYPVKWGVSDFKSMENGYVIESCEFAYNNFKQN
ncbi:MAG: phage tail protein [Bacteroidota bacterium]